MLSRPLGNLTGALTALIALATIAWMVGVKAGLWPSAHGGYWIF